MTASWLPDENLWQITDDRRWWTARDIGGRWHICNERLQSIKPDSRLGRRIIDALADAMEAGRS